MKTIQQLLELSKNPHYTFTPDERRVLDDFLAQNQDSHSKKSQKKNSNELSPKTRVTVRNVVQPIDTYAPDDRTIDVEMS